MAPILSHPTLQALRFDSQPSKETPKARLTGPAHLKVTANSRPRELGTFLEMQPLLHTLHTQPSMRRHVAARAEASSAVAASSSPCVFLGFDFGTSGARVVAIDNECSVLFESQQKYKVAQGQEGCAEDWVHTLFSLLSSVPDSIRGRVGGLSLDATSSTTLIVDRATGHPQSKAMMYNESFNEALPAVKAMAPPHHTVATGTSTLCKMLSWWHANVDPEEGTVAVTVPVLDSEGKSTEFRKERRKAADSLALCHQADFLLRQFLGWGNSSSSSSSPCEIVTDFNNALKVGFDPEPEAYPDWLLDKPYAPLLPRVVAPGSVLGTVSPEISALHRLPQDCKVFAGTTDSIAAFLAARVSDPGQAVTSLGSTLAVKLLSTTRVDDARYGIYSHRLGDTWLVGGASNTGGAVLRSFFNDDQLKALSAGIDPREPSQLDYYPLLGPGERFPTADSTLPPRLSPRPTSDTEFLHGLLESMARIEARGYQLLRDLGASPLILVSTAGGGAKNRAWSAIRERVIGVPVVASQNADSAFGAALLAREGFARTRAPEMVQA